MNKILIVHAFAKAEQEIKEKGVLKPSLTQMATVLSDYLEEKEDFPFGERSLRDYRGIAEKIEHENEDISIKQLAVITGLCKYLGYDTYQSFLDKTTEKGEEVVASLPLKKSKPSKPILTIAVVSMLIILSLLIYNFYNKQRWMVWKEDHYTEVDFDAKKYDIKQLKLYKEDRILSFKKVEATCLYTDFFNPDGSVLIWYGKNRDKQLEYFTDLGLHPETGKTLKPISGYMINKHICEE